MSPLATSTVTASLAAPSIVTIIAFAVVANDQPGIGAANDADVRIASKNPK